MKIGYLCMVCGASCGTASMVYRRNGVEVCAGCFHSSPAANTKLCQCEKCGHFRYLPVGVRPLLCGECRDAPKVEVTMRETTQEEAARVKEMLREAVQDGLSIRFVDAIKAESVPPKRAGQPSTVDLVDEVAARFAGLRKWLDDNLPDGRGKAVSLTELDTARLWALAQADTGGRNGG